MRVYLTGFMASGKSTVGPRVASRLGLPFLDLDRLIAGHDGRSIPEIFDEDGEDAFRRLEAEALQKTADTDELVVALGGGALVDVDNRVFAKEHGWVVYLEVDVETVLERVGEEAERRPLLQDDEGVPLSSEEMEARIEKMMTEREPSYAAAHDTVDATQTVPEIVDAVVDSVRAAEVEDSTSGIG